MCVYRYKFIRVTVKADMILYSGSFRNDLINNSSGYNIAINTICSNLSTRSSGSSRPLWRGNRSSAGFEGLHPNIPPKNPNSNHSVRFFVCSIIVTWSVCRSSGVAWCGFQSSIFSLSLLKKLLSFIFGNGSSPCEKISKIKTPKAYTSLFVEYSSS